MVTKYMGLYDICMIETICLERSLFLLICNANVEIINIIGMTYSGNLCDYEIRKEALMP